MIIISNKTFFSTAQTYRTKAIEALEQRHQGLALLEISEDRGPISDSPAAFGQNQPNVVCQTSEIIATAHTLNRTFAKMV